MRRELARAAVAVLGVAAGVAVMVAIRLANESVTDTFRAAVDSVGGEASVRVRGAAGRFDESLLRDIAWLSEYGDVSPAIDAYAMLATERVDQPAKEAFPRGELLQVLGVDVLRDFNVRDYQLLRTGRDDSQSARQAFGLLRESNSVVLTEKFLRRHGLRVGDKVPLVFDSTPRAFTIRGVLLNRGPARTLDGNFALMDIAAAQIAASRLGLIDYVDLRIDENADTDAVLEQIKDRLPPGLVAESPEASFGRTDSMLSAFQFNLEALSSIALIVGLCLIYNTLSISVAARRNEVGVLRATGASRWQVLSLFLGEALLLTALGLAIGLPLGRYMASFAVSGAAQTVETFYIAGVAESSAGGLTLSFGDWVTTAALVLPLAVLAAWLPSWDAASTPPATAVRQGPASPTALSANRLLLGALVLSMAGWGATQLGPVGGKPVFGFVGELLLMAAGALATPFVLSAACRFMPRFASAVVPRGSCVVRLASANLLGSLPRVSVSTAALAISLSMMVAIAVMVGSFRDNMTYWLENALSADLAVKPVMQSSAVSEARLSPRAVEKLTSDPDIADYLWITSRQVPLGDQAVRVAVTRMGAAAERAGLALKAPKEPLDPSRVDWSREVLVSESFSLRRGLSVGHEFLLPSADSERPLRIAGVYYDYASNQGTILMDQSAYAALYASIDPDPAPSNLSLYLQPGADADATRRRLLESLGPDEQVYCVTNGEIRGEAMRIFDSTFAITYALQAIAVLVSGLGVASTLITVIYQRQREIGLLSLVGATARQVQRVIVCEAVVLGAASQAVGIVLGVLLALVLVFVINVQAFGWTIQFRVPWTFLATSSLAVVGAAALFGLYPAVKAASGNAIQTVRDL